MINDALSFMTDLSLSNMNDSFNREKILKEDGIFYEIIRFDKSEPVTYSSDDLEFGPFLRIEKSPEFIDKYSMRINEINYILLKKIPQNTIDTLLEEKKKLEKVIQL